MEVKDQLTKIETVGQQVQARETVQQQGVHVHYYGAAILTLYNIPERIDIFSILRIFKTKLCTNSTDWSNDAR